MRIHGEAVATHPRAPLDWALAGVCGVLFAVYTVTKLTVARPESGFDVLLDGWLYNAVLVGATLLVARRAQAPGRHQAGGDRVGWALLAVAVGTWTTGNVIWSVLYANPNVEPPEPSVADLFWLVFYLPAIAAIAAFVKAHAGGAKLGLWIDGLIGGLTVTGIVGAFILQPILDATQGDPLLVAVNAAYPTGDLLLILLVVAGIIIRGRFSVWWLVLAVGLGGFAIGDAVYLYQMATDSYTAGLVDFSWVASLLVLGLLGWVPPPGPAVARPNGTVAMPVGFSAVALALVTAHEALHTSEVSFYLGIAAIAASIPRLLLAGRAARELHAVQTQARTDELTGLANRRALNEALPHWCSRASDRAPLALLLIDLDGFKDVNDTLGHEAGDRLLVHVAARLSMALHADDLLVRLGGDEFAIARPVTTHALEAAQLAQQLNRVVAEPIDIDGRAVSVGASIGIAHAPRHAATPSGLLRLADTAMYAAKRSRLGHVEYSDALDHSARLRRELQERVAVGLSDAEFVTYFQPVLDVGSGAVVGAEALVRWAHPTDGILPPAAFLPILNDVGGDGALTSVVLDAAVAAAAGWDRRGFELTVAVNANSGDVQSWKLVEDVEALLERYRLPAERLIIEVTEATVFSDIDAATSTLRALRRIGVRIALDDFGTGYSSLSHLRDLPIDQLKLDRSFITDLGTDLIGETIVRTVISLAQTLHLDLVGEGVEDERTARTLAELGCRHAQGFHWSPALTAAQFDAFLLRHAPRPSHAEVAHEPAAPTLGTVTPLAAH